LDWKVFEGPGGELQKKDWAIGYAKTHACEAVTAGAVFNAQAARRFERGVGELTGQKHKSLV
jgi:hypothetical protein